MRNHINKVYKDPESAFAAFNPLGQSTISLENFIDHKTMKLAGFDKEDMKSYLLREKVFSEKSNEIDFNKFKKFFFP